MVPSTICKEQEFAEVIHESRTQACGQEKAEQQHVRQTALHTHHPLVESHGQLRHHQHPQHAIQLAPVGSLGGSGQQAAGGVEEGSLHRAAIGVVAQHIEGIDARGQGGSVQPCRQSREPQGGGLDEADSRLAAGCPICRWHISPAALSRSPVAATHSARRMGSSTARSTRLSSSKTADHSAPSSLRGSIRMKPTRLTCGNLRVGGCLNSAGGFPLLAARGGKGPPHIPAAPAGGRVPAAEVASALHGGSEVCPPAALLQGHPTTQLLG